MADRYYEIYMVYTSLGSINLELQPILSTLREEYRVLGEKESAAGRPWSLLLCPEASWLSRFGNQKIFIE